MKLEIDFFLFVSSIYCWRIEAFHKSMLKIVAIITTMRNHVDFLFSLFVNHKDKILLCTIIIIWNWMKRCSWNDPNETRGDKLTFHLLFAWEFTQIFPFNENAVDWTIFWTIKALRKSNCFIYAKCINGWDAERILEFQTNGTL